MKAPKLATNANRNNESRAVIAAAVWGVTSFLLGLLIFNDKFTPIFGRDSVGLTSALFTALSAGSVFFWGLYTRHPRIIELRKLQTSKLGLLRRWLKVLALTFVMAALGFLSTSILFFVLQQAFIGVTFDMYAASAVMAVATGLGAYVAYLTAVVLSPMLLSTLLALFLVGGVLTSAISNSDPYWWQLHFSSLGGGGTGSAEVFNITLIIAGLVIWVLAGVLGNDLTALQKRKKRYYPHRVRVFQVALVGIGIALAMVGAFVYDINVIIHNAAAASMAFIFLALVAGLPYIVPNLSRTFYTFSYGMIAALLICIILFYRVEYFNLTTFELSAAAVVFTWLVVLVRQIAAQLKDSGDEQLHISS